MKAQKASTIPESGVPRRFTQAQLGISFQTDLNWQEIPVQRCTGPVKPGLRGLRVIYRGEILTQHECSRPAVRGLAGGPPKEPPSAPPHWITPLRSDTDQLHKQLHSITDRAKQTSNKQATPRPTPEFTHTCGTREALIAQLQLIYFDGSKKPVPVYILVNRFLQINFPLHTKKTYYFRIPGESQNSPVQQNFYTYSYLISDQWQFHWTVWLSKDAAVSFIKQLSLGPMSPTVKCCLEARKGKSYTFQKYFVGWLRCKF